MKNWVSAFLFLSMTGLLFGSEDACTYGLSCSQFFINFCHRHHYIQKCPPSEFYNVKSRRCAVDSNCCNPKISQYALDTVENLSYHNAVEVFRIAKESYYCLRKAQRNIWTPKSGHTTGQKCQLSYLIWSAATFKWQTVRCPALLAFDGRNGCNISFSSCCSAYDTELSIFHFVSHNVMRDLIDAEDECPGFYDLPKLSFEEKF